MLLKYRNLHTCIAWLKLNCKMNNAFVILLVFQNPLMTIKVLILRLNATSKNEKRNYLNKETSTFAFLDSYFSTYVYYLYDNLNAK